MSDVMAPLPKDDPRIVAFEAYKRTDAYQNTRRWAQHPDHVDGSLWAAFLAGWEATRPAEADMERRAKRLLSDSRKARVEQLERHVKQLEAMLPEKLDVCVSCKEGDCDPDDYIHGRAQLIGEDEDLGGLVCEGCVDAYRENEERTAGAERRQGNP